MDTIPIFHPTLKKSLERTKPLEYTITQAGAATAVKYPKDDAMAVMRPACNVSPGKFNVIGPSIATVAVPERMLAKMVVKNTFRTSETILQRH
jgi:hypothetical protein